MAQQCTMTGWVKRRARQFIREFNTPRSKAVRYAAEDWKALQGGRRVDSVDLGRGQRPEDLVGLTMPSPFRPQRKVRSVEEFRRFKAYGTGGQS